MPNLWANVACCTTGLGSHARALADLERYVGASGPKTVSAGALRLLDELRLRYGGSEEDA